MKRRILITDDEANIRLMLRTALESAGYEVDEASNGREALDAIERRLPDLLLLDLSMPVMDGMSVLEALRERSAAEKPRVIVLTAYGSVSAAVKAIRIGAKDFLEKPVTPDDLRLSIASVLDEPVEETAAELELGYGEVLKQIRNELYQGDFKRAEALLMRAADLAGSDPAYFNLLGVLHEAEGRKDIAKKFYGKAIHANRQYEPAQRNMRRLYELATFGKMTQDVSLGNEAEILSGLGGEVHRQYLERLAHLRF